MGEELGGRDFYLDGPFGGEVIGRTYARGLPNLGDEDGALHYVMKRS